jgi:hypothetical protein
MSPTAILQHHAVDDYLRSVPAERTARFTRRRPPSKATGLDGLVARAGHRRRVRLGGARPPVRAAPAARRPIARPQPARGRGRGAGHVAAAHARDRRRARAGRAGGWLTTTARRESLRMRERGSHELPTADDLGGAATAGDEAEAHLDAAACRAAVTRALDSLPPRHRD